MVCTPIFISKDVIIHYIPLVSSMRQFSQRLVHAVVVMISLTAQQAQAQPPRPLRMYTMYAKEGVSARKTH